MRISDIEDSESYEHELVHPTTGEKLGPVFILAGPEHPARKDSMYAAQRRARKRLSKHKGGDVMKALAESDPEEEAAQTLEHVVSCTLGWRELDYPAADMYAFSAANTRALYRDPKRQWLYKQIIATLDETENFIESSSRA